MGNSENQSFYPIEDIQEILKLAIQKESQQPDEDEPLSRDKLLEIAEEMGIDRLTILQAEKDWLQQKKDNKTEQQFIQYRQEKLRDNAIRFLIVSSFLIGIDGLQGNGVSWSLYILLFFMMRLALKTWKTLQTTGEKYQRDLATWRRNTAFRRSIRSLWDKLIS